MGVVLFRGELGGVELSGPQDLQHPVQGLGDGHRAAFLGRIDDVYHLGRKENRRVSLAAACKHTHKQPPAGHAALCACVLKISASLRHTHKEISTGAKLLKEVLSLEHKQVIGSHVGYERTQSESEYQPRAAQPAARFIPGLVHIRPDAIINSLFFQNCD